MNCKEIFSDIVAVWPIPASSIEYDIPFNVRKREYSRSEIRLKDSSLLNTLVYYTVSTNGDEKAIELVENGNTVRSSTKMTVAGRAHDVSIVLITNEKEELSTRMAEQLESLRHDFVIKVADGSYKLLRTIDNAYTCTTEENYSTEYQLKHTISIENYNGIISLTE